MKSSIVNASGANAKREQENASSTTVTSKQQSEKQIPSSGQQQKIMITGDDILIEYVTRLMKTFSQNKISEEELTNEQ